MHGTKEEIDPTGLAAEEAAYAAQLAEIRREGADATPMGTRVSPSTVSPSASGTSRRAPPSNAARNTSGQYAHNLSMSSSSTDSDESSTSVSMSSFMESFSGSDFGF